MTISMYQASVPVLVRMLVNLKAILGKAATHAQAKKIDESVLLNARLYPDMFPLARQVQGACDFARATPARLAAREPFALPNFFFHSTTAYAILRHCGVEIGKSDFIGELD